MPQEIDIAGVKTVVFTQAELDTAIAGAKTGLVTAEDAQKLADSAAAKSRKEAEGKLTDLQAELAKAGNSDAKVAELNKQIAEQAGKLTGSEKLLTGIKALTRGGLTVDQAEFLLQHPKFGEAKFDSDDAVKASLTLANSLGFAAKTVTPPAGNGAAGGPQGGTGTPGVKDMSNADIMKMAGQAMAGERVTLT